MSKKKTAKKTETKVEAKPASRTVDGADGRVLINIYSPGHEPTEFRIHIPNIIGATNLLHRSPEAVAQAVIDGLRAKYGQRVG